MNGVIALKPETSQEQNQGSSVCVSQWGTADAEIKIPSVENPELKGSPFKAWSRSE